MVFPDDHPDHPGLAKGAKVICEERFGISSTHKKSLADLKRMLSEEEDFNSSKYLIEEEMEKRNPPVKVIFYPKVSVSLVFLKLIT